MITDLLEVLNENGEALVDFLIKNELLKGIPGIKNVLQVMRLAPSVPDRIFLAKIRKFVQALEPIKDEARAEMLKMFSESSENRNKIGEIVLLNLERIDELEKAEYIAMVFVCFVYKKIGLSSFKRMVEAISKCYLDDLKEFLSSPPFEEKSDSEAWQRLAFVGLTILKSQNLTETENKNFAERTHFGTEFNSSISMAKSILEKTR